MFETTNINTNNTAPNQSLVESVDSPPKVARDDFLKLLIAQMSNQDPLAPVDNQEFASQLAQFSSLEQLQSIDENIRYGTNMDLVLTQTINNTLASTIIGKEAKAMGNTIVFDSTGTGNYSFQLESAAKDVEVTITDSSGTVVRVLNVGALGEGDHALTWDGKNTNGRSLPEGTYRFEVKATDTEGEEIEVTPLMVGVVTGVRYENGNAVLLINDQSVSFASVLEIGSSDPDNG